MKGRILQKGGLPRREVAGYGVGDLACSMVFNFMSSYLLYYYTDVAGLTVGVAGAVMSAARLIDAAANPVVGVLSDKTHTRWGKLRPYLLFSAAPLAFSVAALFWAYLVPAGGRGVYAMATYALFCLLYTLCNVPYSAMMPNLSEEPAQRARLNRARMACASIGGFLSMGLSLPLIGLFGSGDEGRGFLGLGVFFGVVVAALVLLCFFSTKERIQPPPVAFSLWSLWQTIRKARPWVLFCCAQLFHYMAISTRSSNTMYYAKYELGSQGFASLLLATASFTGFCGALVAPSLVKRFSKRGITIVGYGLFILGSLAIGCTGGGRVVVFLLNVLASLGASLSGSVAFLILGEAIDQAEYATGVRQQGLLTSVSMFMVKLGVVLSSALSALVLDLGGYVPGRAQTGAALAAIRTNYIFLPAAGGLACLALFLCYHLDREYPAINEALRRKHRAGG